MIEHFAIIAACSGEKDLLGMHMATVARFPLVTITSGSQKLLSYWDRQRGVLRLEEIGGSLAPKH
jgi:hypothetical protein